MIKIHKIKLNLTLFLFLFYLLAQGQEILIRNAPANASGTTDLRMPNGTAVHTSMRGHFLLRSEYMGNISPNVLLRTLGMPYYRGTNIPAGGTIKFYLQNTTDNSNTKSMTWATAITEMTEVYNGPFNLPVDPSTHLDLQLNGTDFTYTGGALYVAYEYVGTAFASVSAVNHAQNTGVPLVYVSASTTMTPPATLNPNGSGFVPQMRFGWDNPHGMELSVEDLSVEYGVYNRLWGANDVSVRVANRGYTNQVNVPVTLTISGANTYSTTITIPALAGGEEKTVIFDSIPQPNDGVQTLVASVPDDEDEVPANNELQITQRVACDEVSYTGSRPVYDGIGFNTGSGILAVKYQAQDVPVLVEGVYVYLSDSPNNVGKSVAGQLLNSAGEIVGTSEPIQITAAQLQTWVYFPLATPVSIAAGEVFYAGLLQHAGSPGYFPVGTEGPVNSPSDRNFSFSPAGGSGINYTDLGNFRIGAQVQGMVSWGRSAGGDIIEGEEVTFTASSGYDAYRFMVNGEVVQQGNSNSFTYAPQDEDEVSLEVSNGICTITAESTFVINVLSKNADLADLVLSVAVDPVWAFDPVTLDYTATVPLAINSIVLTPTVQHPGAIVTVQGQPVVSGQPSDAVTLNSGENNIVVVVTAESGATKTYQLKIIRKGSQEIDFQAFLPKTYGDGTFEVGPELSSAGLVITYTSDDANVLSITGNIGTIHHAGKATVKASQVGNEVYDAAPEVTQLLTVDKRPLTITNDPIQKIYGVELDEMSLTGTVTGLLAADGIRVSRSSGGLSADSPVTAVPYAIIATLEDPLGRLDNYLVENVPGGLTVIPAVITGVTLADGSFVYNGSARSLAVSGTLPAGVGVAYTNNSRTDVGSQTVTATVSGTNYQALTLTAQLVVTPAERFLSFPALGEKTYGDADFTAGASSSTGESINYTSSNTAVVQLVNDRIRITGAGTTTITASVPANPNYTGPMEVSQVLTVRKASQSITFNAPADLMRNTGRVPLDVYSSAGLPVNLRVDDVMVATVDGSDLLVHRLGTVRITATQEGDANHEAAADVTVTIRIQDDGPSDILGIRVHQALSPNGDGINDFMIIEGIRDYPDNKVTIFNRNGTIVYEKQGYNNGSVVFRGQGKDGERLPTGTYYYLLEVRDGGVWKQTKGYFILRY